MANSRRKKTRVSDIITNADIKSWKDGDIITITAGTGMGKSFFIKNKLFTYAKEEGKKILMLIHRTNCVKQFENEIKGDKKEGYIDIKTYQAIDTKGLYNKEFDMSRYKYIICDEWHYFLEDASFNKSTDISFNMIMKADNAIRIFMSATGDRMTRYLNNALGIETINYDIPINYSFIRSLTFFNEDSDLETFAKKSIERGEKIIFFIQSAKKAYSFYKKFKDNAMFICSSSNEKYYKYVDIQKVNSMLEHEKFDDLILITTSCLDSGVNIVDGELKRIVIDIKDTGSLIQCMGRKRIQGNEQVDVLIKSINNMQLGGMVKRAQTEVEMADYFRIHTIQEYINKYPREYDRTYIIYDKPVNDNESICTKEINNLMYYKRKFDYADYWEMLQLKKYGYCKYLALKFGFYDEGRRKYTYSVWSHDNSLKAYLGEMVGKVMLQISDRKELIEKINLRGDGHLRKNLEALNIELETKGLDYRIIEFRTTRIINGKKRDFKKAWKVNKIN